MFTEDTKIDPLVTLFAERERRWHEFNKASATAIADAEAFIDRLGADVDKIEAEIAETVATSVEGVAEQVRLLAEANGPSDDLTRRLAKTIICGIETLTAPAVGGNRPADTGSLDDPEGPAS